MGLIRLIGHHPVLTLIALTAYAVFSIALVLLL
jgi:hypothetical protein